tara:strand:- start:347 stop:499 length:153 start_codon:yes stop_codon:yes gene_type:complete
MSTLSILRGEKPYEPPVTILKSTLTLKREAAAAAEAEAAAKKTKKTTTKS